MAFAKNIPRHIDGAKITKWEEVTLSEKEEEAQEAMARDEHNALMKECIRDAITIFTGSDLKMFQSDMIKVGIALFEKRSSHTVYYKEEKAREKVLSRN